MAENREQKRAVALSYDKKTVPTVIATGQGYVAEKILQTAMGADIPIHKDEALLEELSGINLGEHIPPELYQAVAQILVFIMELDKSRDGVFHDK